MKILIDTSIWIGFFRKKPESKILIELLKADRVLTHPFVIGELQMGSLPGHRNQVLTDLQNLPSIKNPPESIISEFIELMKLHGSGLSYVDAALLCTAKANAVNFLTSDKLLLRYAKELDLQPDIQKI